MYENKEFQFLIGRLKTYIIEANHHREDLFQFLIGRLKTYPGKRMAVNLEEFQFLIGRLKTTIISVGSWYFQEVSIPHR